MQVTTVLTGYEQKTGDGQRGAWTLHLFKDAGQTYQTFDSALANQLYGLSFVQSPTGATPTGSSVVIDYDVERRGQHANNKITAVGGGAGAPAATPAATPQAQPAMQQVASLDAKEFRIMRQHGLMDALKAIEIGVVPKPEGSAGLFKTADYFVRYYTDGQSVAQSSAPVGGGEQAAAPVAAEPQPAAAPASAPTSPDDDIPF